MESDRVSQVSEEGSNRGRGKNKRFWTFEEDIVLLRYLHELCCDLSGRVKVVSRVVT